MLRSGTFNISFHIYNISRNYYVGKILFYLLIEQLNLPSNSPICLSYSFSVSLTLFIPIICFIHTLIGKILEEFSC